MRWAILFLFLISVFKVVIAPSFWEIWFCFCANSSCTGKVTKTVAAIETPTPAIAIKIPMILPVKVTPNRDKPPLEPSAVPVIVILVALLWVV